MKPRPQEVDHEKYRVYPDSAEWQNSVAGVEYEETKHITVPGQIQDKMNLYIEHTFEK